MNKSSNAVLTFQRAVLKISSPLVSIHQCRGTLRAKHVTETAKIGRYEREYCIILRLRWCAFMGITNPSGLGNKDTALSFSMLDIASRTL